MSVLDTHMHESCCIEVIKVFTEAHLQILQAHRLEAREARVPHELHQVVELVCMFSHGEEALHHLVHEELVCLRFGTS